MSLTKFEIDCLLETKQKWKKILLMFQSILIKVINH